jgi:hypothetical protein
MLAGCAKKSARKLRRLALVCLKISVFMLCLNVTMRNANSLHLVPSDPAIDNLFLAYGCVKSPSVGTSVECYRKWVVLCAHREKRKALVLLCWVLIRRFDDVDPLIHLGCKRLQMLLVRHLITRGDDIGALRSEDLCESYLVLFLYGVAKAICGLIWIPERVLTTLEGWM